MLPPLSSIKERRKRLEWTQTVLASRSGVSQSTITKIEKGRLVPSYEIADKIFKALEEGENEMRKNKKLVKDIMVKDVIFVSPSDTLDKVIMLMKKHAISQVPVIKDNNLLGMIYEMSIIEAQEKYGRVARELRAREIMELPPPIIREDTQISGVRELLRQYPALIVMDNKEIRGIVTRSDLVYMSSKD